MSTRTIILGIISLLLVYNAYVFTLVTIAKLNVEAKYEISNEMAPEESEKILERKERELDRIERPYDFSINFYLFFYMPLILLSCFSIYMTYRFYRKDKRAET